MHPQGRKETCKYALHNFDSELVSCEPEAVQEILPQLNQALIEFGLSRELNTGVPAPMSTD